MGLLGSLNSIFGFSDPIKKTNENPDVQNNTNALREMISQFNQSDSTRAYDVARNNIVNDAFVQSQQLGQALNRSMNSRGLLNSGLTTQGQVGITNQVNANTQKALANLEAQKIQDDEKRRAMTVDWLKSLLYQDMARDQYNRGYNLRLQQANNQAQAGFSNMLAGVGEGVGTYYGTK